MARDVRDTVIHADKHSKVLRVQPGDGFIDLTLSRGINTASHAYEETGARYGSNAMIALVLP